MHQNKLQKERVQDVVDVNIMKLWSFSRSSIFEV